MTEPSAIEIVFETDSEIVLRDGPSVGNAFKSLDFVPGSALRGAFAGKWFSQRSADEEFDDLFNRSVRVCDARPLSTGGLRTFPVPNSISRCKSGCPEPTVSDGFAQQLQHAANPAAPPPSPLCSACGGALKPVGGYVDAEGNPPASARLRPRGQTATADDAALDGSLRYREALPRGEQLASWLVGPSDALNRFVEACDITGGLVINVGESRSTRGRLRVRAASPVDLPDQEDSDVLVVLASRTITVDDHLRPHDHFVDVVSDDGERALMGANGAPMRWLGRTVPVAGWNSGQGIPKPTDWALSAGTAAAYELLGDRCFGDRFIDHGVGLRRTEGFGEVVLLNSEEHSQLRNKIAERLGGK